jgi:hypothetical protein
MSKITKQKQIEAEWQNNFLEKLKTVSNHQLVLSVMTAAGGDWYDGDFTFGGQWRFDKMKEELSRRMLESGFINTEITSEYVMGYTLDEMPWEHEAEKKINELHKKLKKENKKDWEGCKEK